MTDRFNLVSYATGTYLAFQEALLESARLFDVDATYLWTSDRFRETAFYKSNQETLNSPRGAGYWLWKPYMIMDALEKSEPDSLILYADAAVVISDSLEPLKPLLRDGNGIMVFQDGHYFQNKCYTKQDAFVYMDCNEPKYWFAPQLQAGVTAFRNCPQARAFVSEWLRYCQDPRILTDRPNECGQSNWTDFIDHRHDQSVLTNLALKNGIIPYRELSSWGRDFTIHMSYTAEGASYDLRYEMADSPYGILTSPQRRRPRPNVPFLKRAIRKVGRHLASI